MSVLDRAALEASPLADLHAIATELSIDGFRRLRKADLIDGIVARQDGAEPAIASGDALPATEAEAEAVETGSAGESPTGKSSAEASTGEEGGVAAGGAGGARASGRQPRTGAERAPRTRAKPASAVPDSAEAQSAEDEGAEDEGADDESAARDSAAEGSGTASSRRRRGRRGGRGRGVGRDGGFAEDGAGSAADAAGSAADAAGSAADRAGSAEDGAGSAADAAGSDADTDLAAGDAVAPSVAGRGEASEGSDAEATVVEGVVELLANGSGFVRVSPPEASDDDVYISAAQVKRCGFVSGDRVSGPQRAPHRSERFPSLVRVDTINGRPAVELADRARYDDLPAAFPDHRFRLGSEDATMKAIEWLTPFGRGSRVTITGGAWAGKSHALRQLAGEMPVADEKISVLVALAGVRPEEISDWSSGPVAPAAAVSFAVSADAQAHVVELVVDQARRIAARGGDAVVLIDSLDGVHPPTARKLLAAARNIVGGGSLTVIATSSTPIGGETTVIALDAALTSTGRFPALDLIASGTLRPELLVGEAGAQAIASARAEAQQ